MSAEHGHGHGHGGETPETIIVSLLLAFLGIGIILEATQEVVQGVVAPNAAGHGGHH